MAFFALSLNVKILFWPLNRTLSGATTPSQSRPRSDSNEVVLYTSQSSNIPEDSPSDCLVSYGGLYFSGGGSYTSAEMLSVFITIQAD